MSWRNAFVATLVALVAYGCDKAKPDYAKCVQAEAANDFSSAWQACNAAVGSDPTSESGKASIVKLGLMKPQYDKWKADQQATAAREAEEKRRQEAAADKSAADARAAAARSARRSVQRAYVGRERDGECIDKGLPDYRWEYEGGTREEIDLVASADGCGHLLPGRSDFFLFKVFCCPEQP
jgi:hypothetical protein